MHKNPYLITLFSLILYLIISFLFCKEAVRENTTLADDNVQAATGASSQTAAGSLDTVAIRDILVSYSPTNPVQTVFGDTWFEVFGDGYGGGILSYKCHTGEIGQWQSAVCETVGYDGVTDVLPNYDITADWIYPMTDQWGWLIND